MKVTYKTKKKDNPNVKIYVMVCTDAEKAAYKTAKGENYVEDESGRPLYFTQRALSSEVDYQFKDGSLRTEAETKVQATLNLLAKYDGMSLEDLQKANQIKALEAGL